MFTVPQEYHNMTAGQYQRPGTAKKVSYIQNQASGTAVPQHRYLSRPTDKQTDEVQKKDKT